MEEVCLSQGLWLDLIFDTEHVAFECKSIVIVPPSDRVKRNLEGICMYACVSESGFGDTHTFTMIQRIIQMYYITHQFTCIRVFFSLKAI